jgi:hypothetical protein
VVSLIVREKSTITKKKLITRITATKPRIPVNVKNRLTGKKVNRLALNSTSLESVLQGVKGFKAVTDKDGKTVDHECEVEFKTVNSARTKLY